MYVKVKDKLLDWVSAYKYDIGASVYIIGICVLARFQIKLDGPWFRVLLFPAIPFINSVEHFFCVVLLLSTMWWYFPGAWINANGVSMYTVLAILIMVKIIMEKKPQRPQRCQLLMLGLLGAAVVASWRLSAYSERYGLVAMLILISMAALVGELAGFDLKKVTDILPRLAFILTLWYCACAIVAPSFTGSGRLSIDARVNVNTFGLSCAILAVILVLSFYFVGRRPWQLTGGFAALVLLILSGSRGALFGFALACAAALLLDAKRRYSARRVLLVVFAAAVVLLAIILILPLLGMTRFRLSNLIHSAGTSDRINIWTSLLSFIFTGSTWILGYGPGPVCTNYVTLDIMGQEIGSHNTFLEAFGELGLVGLGLTVAYTLFSILSVTRRSKTNVRAYPLLGLAVYILVHGMVESFYQCFFFWAVLALCGSGYTKGDVCCKNTESSEKKL